MLADVMKQREKEKRLYLQEEIEKYNKPYKRDTIVYFSDFNIIGGIETWIYNLSKRYEFSVVYRNIPVEQRNKFKDIEFIKDVGQPIECDTLIFTLIGYDPNIKAKKRILFIHGVYTDESQYVMPECDEIYAVSKVAAECFEKVSGRKVKVLYNLVDIEETTKPLIIGVFSRLSKEKGKWRIEYLIDKLKASNKPFLMLIFTDLPFDESDKRVIFFEPVMNPTGWMSKCDYICQLSDTEAGCLTMQESLKMGIPVITTKLPILEEFGINETNAKILDFDMSNLDIEDLWNIPKVKWQEPISKEWDFMKKRVLRAKKHEEETILIPKEEPKKTTRKKKVE